MIKKGDKVIVRSGKDKKKSGEVKKVFPKQGLVVVEGVNIRKRHRRSGTGNDAKGKILEMEMPINISNVQLDS